MITAGMSGLTYGGMDFGLLDPNKFRSGVDNSYLIHSCAGSNPATPSSFLNRS